MPLPLHTVGPSEGSPHTHTINGRGGFAGLCGFCTWFPLADEATSIIREHLYSFDRLTNLKRLYLGDKKSGQGPPARVQQLLSTPILLQHNRDDDTISVENGERMRGILVQLGFECQWYDYGDGGHWFNEPRGINDLVCFLQKAIYGRTKSLEISPIITSPAITGYNLILTNGGVPRGCVVL